MKPIKTMFGKQEKRSSLVVGNFLVNTNAGAKSTTIVVQAGDLPMLLVCVTNQNATNSVVTDDQGGTYSVNGAGSNSLPNRSTANFTRNSFVAVAGTLTITHTPSAVSTTCDGSGIFAFAVRGLGPSYVYGSNGAFRNGPPDGAATMTMGFPPKPGSTGVGIIISTNLAAGIPVGWTLMTSGSYATPTLYYTVAYLNGMPDQVTSWGGSLANWCGQVNEIQTYPEP